MGKVIALPPVVLEPGIVLDRIYQGEHFTMVCMTANLAEIGEMKMPDWEIEIDTGVITKA
jgi:hypothetical protein